VAAPVLGPLESCLILACRLPMLVVGGRVILVGNYLLVIIRLA
jgi:hypothetical protein